METCVLMSLCVSSDIYSDDQLNWSSELQSSHKHTFETTTELLHSLSMY